MTHEQCEILSNQAVAACAVRLLPGLPGAPRGVRGRRPQGRRRRRDRPRGPRCGASGGVAVAGASGRAAGRPSARRCSAGSALLLTAFAALVHFVALVAPRPRRRPGPGAVGQHVRVHAHRRRSSWSRSTCCCTAGSGSPGWRRSSSRFVLALLMVAVLVALRPGRPAAEALQSPLAGDPRRRRDHRHRRVHPRRDGLGAVPGQGARPGPRPRPDRLPRPGARRWPALDRLAYRMHAFAFPVWTFAVLITGPIWAHQAWASLLGLGPQGGLGVHHLGRLRRLPARPRDGRLEGPQRRDPGAGRAGDAVVQLRRDQLLLRLRSQHSYAVELVVTAVGG